MKHRLGGPAWECASGRVVRSHAVAMVALTVTLMLAVLAPSAWSQKKSKKDKPPLEGQPMPELPIPESDKIDTAIGEMLGAFQLGDIEEMHKHYADNATFVSGAFEPPLVGWQNYVTSYQRQRAAFPGMQIIRRNTVVYPHGDVAWVAYQWEFVAMYNGKPYNARGQTTLVLNKIDGKWTIVYNHTSQICENRGAAASTQPVSPAPAQNPPATVPPKPGS